MSKLLNISIAVLLLTSPAWADWDPGDDHKMHYPQLPDPYGWDVSVMAPNKIADDFLCTQSGYITDVHLWGSVQGDYFPFVPGFDLNTTTVESSIPVIGIEVQAHLSIHDNIPDPDGPADPGYSMPGALLWEGDISDATIVPVDTPSLQGWYDPIEGYWEPDDHQYYFQVNIDIPPGIAFYQDQGNTYWLDVQVSVSPIYAFGSLNNNEFILPKIGWKTSLDHWNDDAVYMDLQGQWQELRDPLTAESLDLAFVITPEPATLLILALGLIPALLRLRRRKRA